MLDGSIGAIVFVGPAGKGAHTQLVHRAVQTAALDLIDTLHTLGVYPLIVAGPDLHWLPADSVVIRDTNSEAFHFGRRLAELIERYEVSPVMYFGAGSAPLFDSEMIGLMQGMLYQSEFVRGGSIPSHIALTNNLHSSDWVALTHATDALDIIRRSERDNGLAWMLQEEWQYDVRVLAGVRPASSMDIDTPTDLAIVRQHPSCSSRLRALLRDPLLDRVPVEPVIDVVSRDGSRLALIGRVSPLAWQAISKATQCWIRVFSEERGMVASERIVRGEVKSLVGRLLDILGPEAFFAELATLADAAIIDSRVFMAAAGHYPDDGERFASDLYEIDAIEDDWLRRFTVAARDAPIPVLLGGHSVVAGGLYALTDVIAERRRAR